VAAIYFTLGHYAAELTRNMMGDWRLISQGMVARRPNVWREINEKAHL